MMGCLATVVWDDGYLAYDFGDHPLNPRRLEFTISLARELGVLDNVAILAPASATDTELLTVHDEAYLQAVREASVDPSFHGFGLGTGDDPVFAGMYEASALIAGGSRDAATQVWDGRALHAVNIAGGLHHAMRGHASGFCVFNDVVLAIRTLLAAGASRVAYVDVDVHHGDGVQKAFYDDPRVLTISLHQDPRTLFPGTGFAAEVGVSAGEGTAINVALPPGTGDTGWLRAFAAVVPAAVRSFAPDVLVTQCGCDTHHEDPLANLALTVDGQRSAIAILHQLAREVAQGRWVALGGGGYGVVRCVPRTWTHLIAEAAGTPIDPATPVPEAWATQLRHRGVTSRLPDRMGEVPSGPTFES
jgi:acetoin utilization protein AcuC